MNTTRVKLKNKDEIDESHKSQLKFEYNVYLLNYKIKIFKNLKPRLIKTQFYSPECINLVVD